MVIGLGAALLAAVVFGVGAVVQAIAARHGRLVSGLMALVAVSYLIGWLLHVVSIALVPLYVAQVGISASLAVTAVTAAAVVGEPLAARHLLAVGVLVAGMALLAVAAGPVGHHRFDTIQTVTLYAALMLTLVLGLMAMRVGGQRGGVLLGCLGGLAYAGSPIATRSLVDPAWDWTDVAAGPRRRTVRSARILALLGRPTARVGRRRERSTRRTPDRGACRSGGGDVR